MSFPLAAGGRAIMSCGALLLLRCQNIRRRPNGRRTKPFGDDSKIAQYGDDEQSPPEVYNQRRRDGTLERREDDAADDDEEEREDGGEEEGAGAANEAAEDATANENSSDVPASSSKLSTKGSQASSSTKGSAAAKEGSAKGGSVDGKSSSQDNSGDADSVKTPCDVSDAKSGKSYVSLKERLEKRGEIVDGIHAADLTDREGCHAAPGLGDVLQAVDRACSPRVADAKEMLGEAGGLVGDAAKKRWEKLCSPDEGELVKDAKELIKGEEARDGAVVASGRSQETMETTETDGITADTTKLSRDETMETKDSIDILFKYFGCAAGR